MKFGQVVVCCMTNISNMFLSQYWRLETSSRPCYDFIEMTNIVRSGHFHSWLLPFLNAPYSPFHKNETLES